jgi:hypothetical protein
LPGIPGAPIVLEVVAAIPRRTVRQLTEVLLRRGGEGDPEAADMGDQLPQ